jgi:hypothetical protein
MPLNLPAGSLWNAAEFQKLQVVNMQPMSVGDGKTNIAQQPVEVQMAIAALDFLDDD